MKILRFPHLRMLAASRFWALVETETMINLKLDKKLTLTTHNPKNRELI
jgi:hypothetical protein